MTTRFPAQALPLPDTERPSAVLLHLSPLLGYVLPSFGHLLGPVLAWLALRERSAALDEQGKESLNFQLSLTIYGLVLSAVVTALFLLGFLGGLGGLFAGAATNSAAPASLGLFAFFGSFAALFAVLVPVMLLFSLFPLIVMVLAVVSVNAGRPYRYPLTLRLIR